VPLAWALAGAALLAVGTVGGGYAYLRSLGRGIYQDAPIAVDEVRRDEAALGAVVERVAAAQRTGGEAALSELDWNRFLGDEVLADPARAIRFELAPPFLRLRLAQRDPDGGRYLNAALLVQLYPASDGLGLAVRAGQVGEVSIDSTRGEWARTRIERQLAAELLGNPRVGPLLDGLVDARVEGDAVRLRYQSPR
jgi:hypothetical protein